MNGFDIVTLFDIYYSGRIEQSFMKQLYFRLFSTQEGLIWLKQ